jgi:MFS transporter, DHA2 family, methylenomycin A resistance protein
VFNASRQTGGAFGVAVLGALLAAGRNPVSLHVPFLAIAGGYAAAMALAVAGRRTAQTTTRSRP